MGYIKLDKRLEKVVSYVRDKSRVADIGTDHGYVAAFLVKNNISPFCIAADINQGPLDNALKTVRESGIEDKVQLVLSDGLENIEPDSFDDVIIAGMGGILISEILSAYSPIKNSRYNIIAQPMTHAEVLREYFVKNGFQILGESVASDGNKLYCVINAQYTGKIEQVEKSYYYLGRLPENEDKLSKEYMRKIIQSLEKKADALVAAGAEEGRELKALVNEMVNISGINAADKVTVKDVYNFIDSFSPFENQCDWDNSGMLIGDFDKQVTKIGIALDLTAQALEDAVSKGADLIVTHHPVIYNPQKTFTKGNIAYEAAVSGMSVISAHTCFDSAQGGVNDILCSILGIKNAAPVETPEESASPILRIGDVEETNAIQFAKNVSEALTTVCRVVECTKPIRRVAVCGGAGMSFLDAAIKAGADAYVTGDISHHQMLDAADKGITVVAAGHYETENPSMYIMRDLLKKKFPFAKIYLLSQSNPIKFIG